MNWVTEVFGHDAQLAAINALHDAETDRKPLSARVEVVARSLLAGAIEPMEPKAMAKALGRLWGDAQGGPGPRRAIEDRAEDLKHLVALIKLFDQMGQG